ncbi:hypothetical protein A2867_00110 [Candidatus Daviesbacteria bacterium RIFCSPHIGHO2_01_FULL_40_11]|uniref:Cell envelope-related transcriptional attenuator domain-containing protein n=1 Tax=Candidatus Daviesbacteria bacterium RIFCSPHIGHO2_01_FULL_40_11 TaxID=1797762 RepID=A0A1F5JM91_9BACT|nr:MAG: hypothetical protein A2867_00110 [Candidatus Daviesbacteria bacterium RIFCSPHIGHO2_01_FULL_40_11]OGE62736.1 MAG: hypothetical protein A2964_00430 [Candidatus Daviesbacteria bacterium RIFCSPLOWO2_01_FULL_40_27]
MEEQPAEPLRSPEGPREVLGRMIANERLADNMNVPTLLQDLHLFIKIGTKGPNTLDYLRRVGNDKRIRIALLEEIDRSDGLKDGKKVLEGIELAHFFGMDKLPKTSKYFSYLKNEYKPKKRSGLKRKMVLATGAGLIAAASIASTGGPAAPIGKFLGELSKGQSTSQKGPSTQSPVKLETKPATALKAPENLLNEFIKPFAEEAMERRKQWAESDPEYRHMIDKELNENRLNVVVFGYGEEHGETYEDYGGAPSILSLDLKTGKIAIVHFSRDIRTPDLERLLPEGQRQPIALRSLYRIGGTGEKGFNQMRHVIGRMSGLIADYQLVMKDVVLRDIIAQLADGNLEIDAPKDHNTQPFRLDRVQYGDDLIQKGKQNMSTMQLMRYILAEDKNPQGKEDERSYRKNQVTEALIKIMRDKFREKSLLEKVAYLNQIKSLIEGEIKNKNLELEFDLNIMSRAFEGIFGITGRFLDNWGQNIEFTVPEVDRNKEIVFHDPSFGDGSVTRVHNIFNHPNYNGRTDNPRLLEEVRAKKLPDWMLIPDEGNPYSNDLVKDYWQSIREKVKKTLINTAASSPSTPTKIPTPSPTATSTATPRPTETPTPKPTPTPEVKTFKKDILREQLTPIIYSKIEQIRAERAAQDPEYYNRINKELNEGKINILITGGREDDPLTDSIQLFSWDPNTNTLYAVAFPRDLQSPEVLNKTKDPTNSRINQALGKGGPELLRLAIENATALSVDLYMHTNFDVLKDVINKTIGTIDIEFDKDIVDNAYPTEDNGIKRIFYPKGKNTLTGEQALETARTRHGDNDYERAKRQQKIIEALIRKIFSENILNQARYLYTMRDIWYQKVHESGTLKPDFDLDDLFFHDLKRVIEQIPQMAWDKLIKGVKVAEIPTIFATGISSKNFVVGAGVPRLSITKISGGNPNTSNPRRDYWQRTRTFAEKFITENAGEPPDEKEITIEIPTEE